MTLGEVIAQYRAEKKISLSAFAKRAGISKAYLHYLEKGENPGTGKPLNPTMETTLACCKAMDMDILQLFEKLDPEIAVQTKEKYQRREDGCNIQDDDGPPLLNPTQFTPNIPSEVPQGIPLTNETLTAAIKERRLLLLPTRIPRKGDFVYLPLKEFMMVGSYYVTEAGGGLFRAESGAGLSIVFSIFDLDKNIFTTRNGADAIIQMWKDKARSKF